MEEEQRTKKGGDDSRKKAKAPTILRGKRETTGVLSEAAHSLSLLLDFCPFSVLIFKIIIHSNRFIMRTCYISIRCHHVDWVALARGVAGRETRNSIRA